MATLEEVNKLPDSFVYDMELTVEVIQTHAISLRKRDFRMMLEDGVDIENDYAIARWLKRRGELDSMNWDTWEIDRIEPQMSEAQEDGETYCNSMDEVFAIMDHEEGEGK